MASACQGAGSASASVCMGALQAMQAPVHAHRRAPGPGRPSLSGRWFRRLLHHRRLRPAGAPGSSRPETPMREVPPFHRPLPPHRMRRTRSSASGGGRSYPHPAPFSRREPRRSFTLRDHSLYPCRTALRWEARAPSGILTLGIMLNLAVLVLAHRRPSPVRSAGWRSGCTAAASPSGLSNQVRSIPTKGILVGRHRPGWCRGVLRLDLFAVPHAVEVGERPGPSASRTTP